MIRTVGLAGAGFILLYAALSVLTGQRNVALGDLAQMVPPLVFAAFTFALARRCRGQVRMFWNLNAIHGLIWGLGQVVWTYYELTQGSVPVISLTDPLFFVSSIPVAASLYGRPERDRPRWLFDIVVLDLVLIAMFSAFVYVYFVVSITITNGNDELYAASVTQLFNGRNFCLAAWAVYVWRTAPAPGWRRMLGFYALALSVTFAAGVIYDFAGTSGRYQTGGWWDLAWVLPFVIMSLAAAVAYDERLFEPAEEAPVLSRLPMVSLIAIALLVAIPAIDEIARRLMHVSDAIDLVRTRLALTMMIPFGVGVVIREFLSRRALLRASQELVSAREQLVQKDKLAAVGQLVSGLAHELNNPLQGILGYAELMLASRPSPTEGDEVTAIRDNANRAAGIVRNLMMFAGRTASARGWQQINQVVRDAVAIRGPQLHASGIDLRLEMLDRLPLVYVDRVRFEDVLVKLIQNAEAAIASRREGHGRGSPVPQRARGEIVIATRSQVEPDRILIEVADNGSGLRDEDRHRVFDPFFTTRAVGQGTGLGLSVCYGIVREHGGQITARNADSGGAVFTVELPATAESLPRSAPTTAVNLPVPVAAPRPALSAQQYAMVAPPAGGLDRSSRTRKALVVDDEESNAALVRRVLASADYEVESTTQSRRALAMIERTAYDAVICDVKMPELSGQELYGRVCRVRPEMARRFIFITGDIDSEDTREFLDHTRCSYFMKPFNLERLTAAVDMLIGTRTPETTA